MNLGALTQFVTDGARRTRNHLMLAINVTAEPAFVSSGKRCETYEVDVAVSPLDAEKVFIDAESFTQTVALGREAMQAWFETSDGQRFLSRF